MKCFHKKPGPQPPVGTKRHTLRVTLNSPVVLIFAGLCFIATLLGQITDGWTDRTLFSTYRAPMSDLLLYPRLFLHVLGHNGWEHFINNMMYLLILGPMIEEKYGPKATVMLIVITAFITGLFNNLLFPNAMMLGASGVVFAMILLSSLTGMREHTLPLTFILVTVLYLGEQVYSMIAVQEHISYMAHIIGGATGAGLGWLMQRRRGFRYRIDRPEPPRL